MARHALHLVPDVDPATTVVMTEDLERAIRNVVELADDLDAGIEAAVHRLWADSRAGAINELNRLGLRVQRLRDDYAALVGDEHLPPAPRRLS